MADITIPISEVRTGPAEEQLVLEVLRSGHLAQGPMVARLENLFTAVAGTRHAIAVSSGTTALVAALQVSELAPGDEVVTSPFTFVATVNAILEAGAVVRFADIGLDDFCVDPDAVRAVMSDRVKVLMPVHLYGQPAAMDLLAPLARDHGVRIVEDAAQAHGAAVDGRPVGGHGLACFSLYATKNVMTGEGGIITTDDDTLADRLRVLRNQGMRARYEYEVAGHNYRLTDLQAAVGVPQLERLEETTEKRRANAALLDDGLAGIPGLVRPVVVAGRTHVYHQYTVRITEEAAISRDALVEGLAAEGIGAGVYYPRPVYDYAPYRDHPGVVIAPTPNAERAGREVVSLPVHPYVTEAGIQRIVTTTRRLLGG